MKSHNKVDHQYIINDPLHQLFDTVDVISVQGYDQERRVIYWNKGSELLYGYKQEEALGQKLENLIIPNEMHDLVIAAHSDWINKGIKIPSSEITLCDKHAKDITVFSSHVMFTNQYHRKQMYCIDINLADLKHAQANAKFKENMFETLVDASPDLFLIMNTESIIIDYHTTESDNFALSSAPIINQNITTIFPEDIAFKFKNHIDKIIKHKKMLSFEYEQHTPQGVAYFEVRMSYLPQYEQIITIIRDITEQYKSAEIIRHQAYFDPLTSLPNRLLSLDRLSQMLIKVSKNGEKTAILFLDLDDFKKVNDSLGHGMGDKILLESAKRLEQVVQKKDTVGRFGGDEFIILLPEITDNNQALITAEKLLKAFRAPFKINGRELIITLSIGIAISPENGNSPDELLSHADTAMYQAKSLGRNTYSFFTKEMNTAMLRRFEIEEQMHGALKRNEFELYFQPQIDVKDSSIIGAEALLRWHNSILSTIGPDEFIPIAEQTGLIISIGRFVIEEALIFLSRWQIEDHKKYTIAINLSPTQFRDVALVSFIKQSLQKHNIEPKYLEIEITEGVLMSGESYIHEALMEMNQLGVKLSMDDFGTGYSSLSYLREYTFDVLKIDQSFVHGLPENEADCKLVKATIAMAHSLGLHVIAEGVETKPQLNLLARLGCDFAQGYYFSKPKPKEEVIEFSAKK